MRKAISPIIAAVLLIAVAVGIGVLVTNWATSWVGQRTNDPSVSCSVGTNYIIESARWNFTGNENKLLLKIVNKGTEKLYNFSVTLDNETDIMRFNYTNSNIDQGGISKTNKLGREESAFIKIDLSSNTTFGSTLNKITVGNAACKSISASTTKIANYP